MNLHNATPVVVQPAAMPPQRALVLLHGRGNSARGILQLAQHLETRNTLLVAPQASDNTWYPQRFVASISSNEPYLSAALDALDRAMTLALEAGVATAQTVVLGFSQGACLALEYAVRNPKPYGALVALSGGLIGERVDVTRYLGKLEGVPILMRVHENDPHIPAGRVQDSATVLQNMGAKVNLQFHAGFGHQVLPEDIAAINSLLATLS
jgi:predicted esterase